MNKGLKIGIVITIIIVIIGIVGLAIFKHTLELNKQLKI